MTDDLNDKRSLVVSCLWSMLSALPVLLIDNRTGEAIHSRADLLDALEHPERLPPHLRPELPPVPAMPFLGRREQAAVLMVCVQCGAELRACRRYRGLSPQAAALAAGWRRVAGGQRPRPFEALPSAFLCGGCR